jgi:hypothetical protein
VKQLINNNQSTAQANCNISGVCKYDSADYGASWATSAAITASLAAIFPEPINGDIAILDNTNGAGERRFYFYAAGAWENIGTTTIGAGAVGTTELAANALAASAAGRGKIATNFFDNATVDAKFATAAFAADADSLGKFADGIWTLAKLAQEAKTHILPVYVPALTANTDLTLPVMNVPVGFVVNVLTASITPMGASAGIDDSNKSTWAVTDGTNTLVSKEFDADPAFPSSGTNTDLGSIDANYDNVAAGTPINLVITNGTTAATPQSMFYMTYYLSAA